MIVYFVYGIRNSKERVYRNQKVYTCFDNITFRNNNKKYKQRQMSINDQGFKNFTFLDQMVKKKKSKKFK